MTEKAAYPNEETFNQISNTLQMIKPLSTLNKKVDQK